MATTPVTQINLFNAPDQCLTAQAWQWSAVPNGNQGAAVPLASFTDRSVQVTGVQGVGGSMQLEGSNDNVNWFILRDPLGSNLVFTTIGTSNLKQILEYTRFIRPNVTAGDGTTAYTVIVIAATGARG